MKKNLFKTLLLASKKSVAGLILLALLSGNLYAQNEDEKQLNIKPLEETVERSMLAGKVDCSCNNNLIKDGGFENVSVSGSNITSASNPWKPNSYSPQWQAIDGPCNNGVISMWGNQAVFESIIQLNSLMAGSQYKIKVTVRAVNLNPLEPVVRLKITSGASSQSTPNVSTAWTTYTIDPFTAGSSDIILQPENNSTLNDGAHVSWIQIDNICIEKACDIPDEKCNPDFTASTFTLNSQCNVVADFNPTITAGAEHYWGMLPASGLTDVTPVPLATIMSGGTFGLGINSAGTVTPIGMGTGINASNSGYGYQYQGFGFGSCFKITHYIKCCNKWYSKTKTYCTKLCSDVRESRGTGELTEVNEINPAAKKVLRKE